MAFLKGDRNLTEMFARFNRDYFGGRKPCYRVTRYPLRVYKGYCDTEHRRILIRPGFEGDGLTALLLHEMCHIGCPGHGGRFQDRIRGLIPLVSTSVASELEVDLGRGQTLRESISSRLDSLAMEYPATPWQRVRRMLMALELPPPFNEQERRRNARRLVHARREWTRLSREYLELGIAPWRIG